MEEKKWLRRHQIYENKPEPVNVHLLRSTGIDFQPVGPVREPRAGIFKEAMGARNRRGRGLSYRPARLNRLVEFIPWNRFQAP